MAASDPRCDCGAVLDLTCVELGVIEGTDCQAVVRTYECPDCAHTRRSVEVPNVSLVRAAMEFPDVVGVTVVVPATGAAYRLLPGDDGCDAAEPEKKTRK